jgi:hypothetical protein
VGDEEVPAFEAVDFLTLTLLVVQLVTSAPARRLRDSWLRI